ncbi:hypothetical protein N7510_003327 [Penicillium lagena]|uniref:uncharacterized protein n=1 Tax=Penicillium lagena TaxID=94218 RepID=UPI00254210E7|nr:uncharacterized protein N7510_003327 [Penicillium lagena]KAJ5619343.1 hypothetical protein N7510_003327 [Penicillium lagena]
MSSCKAKLNNKVAIIGAGDVGAAAANMLILQSATSELLIVDINAALKNAQVSDLSDVSYVCGSKTRVRAATHQEAAQSDIVLITIGSKYYAGETSVQHTYQKLSIIRSVISSMKPFGTNTILLVVANPVDLFTSFIHDIAGLPETRVIGSGTWLDAIRVSSILAEKAKMAASSINLPILGIHGNSQVVAWSAAIVDDTSLDEALSSAALNRDEVLNECESRKQKMIRGKGKMSLGIGSLVARICQAIISDNGSVCNISHFQPNWGCCFSLPAVLGKAGIVKTFEMPLNSSELRFLEVSARDLKDRLATIYEQK